MWDHIDDYLSECSHLSRATVETYFHHLRMAAAVAPDGRGLAEALRRAGYRPGSVVSVLRSVRAYARWCGQCGYAVSVPRVPRVPSCAPRAASAADFARLWAVAATARERLVLLLLRDTGARIGALCGLRWEDVDLDGRRAVVVSKGRLAPLYLSARLVSALRDAPRGSDRVIGMSPSGVRQMLRRLARRAGVRGRVNPHAWRHAFARELLARGCDLSRVSRLLGHTDVATTMRYYALWADGDVDAAYRRYWDVDDIARAPSVDTTAR